MTVAELVSWLQTQDQEATIQGVKDRVQYPYSIPFADEEYYVQITLVPVAAEIRKVLSETVTD